LAVIERLRDARELALEAVVIVVSILAAFGLDTMWEARRERAEEEAVLTGLQTEFLAARAELEWRLALHRRIEGSVRSTLSALKRGLEEEAAFVSVPDTALGWAYIPPTTQLSMGTLTGLLGAGRLGVIRDRELRAALAGWEGLLDELTEEEERSADYVLSHLGPVLRERMDVTPFRSIVGPLFEGTLSETQRARESRVPVDFETVGVFAGRLQILTHGIEEFAPVQEEVERILGLIRSSLER
jgi:hypothetical protein